jgi:kynurenine formamidase
VAAAATAAIPTAARANGREPTGGEIHQVVDLTHTLDELFPTYSGQQQLEIEVLATFENNGANLKRWLLAEHTGTHMDAPIHASLDQDTADVIPVESLVVPLVVVDIRAKVSDNDDAQLTPDDLATWESQHGRIPEGACVAMYSGWETRLGTPGAFRNADSEGIMHFPGFHVDAATFLIEEREVHGIAVDTLSLDYGPSADFATHYAWLGSNRWGMESVASLGSMPAHGATLVAGGPKIAGATGGLCRCIGLIHTE